MTRKDTGLAVLVALIWGLNFVAIEDALEVFPPMLLGSVRFVLSALPVLFVRRPAVPLRLIAIVGMGTGTIQFAALFAAMDNDLSPGLASIVLQVQTGITVILAAVFLHERPGRPQVLGLAVALSGLLLIAGFRGGSATIVGLLLALLAACAWATGNVATRLARPADPFAFVVWMSLVPPLPLLALAFLFDGSAAIRRVPGDLTLRAVLALLFIAAASTLVGYVLWSGLLRRNDAAKVVPFALLVPIVGMTASAIAFDERYAAGQLTGAGLILVGVFLTTRQRATVTPR